MRFKLALITGASSGIGEALAKLLTSQGIPVILSGRNRPRLEELGQQIKAKKIVITDLQVRQERAELVKAIYENAPDLVINNAGFGRYGDLFSIDVEDQLSLLEVNGAAPLELTLHAARAMVGANKQGVIVNVSSIAGEYPCPGMSVYGAAKAFLTKVSQALNAELSSKGVSILVSCPGMVATDFANRAAKKQVDISGHGPIMTPEFAAQQIWDQILKGKKKHTFNWQYRVASLIATYLLPVSLIKKIVWKRIEKRI